MIKKVLLVVVGLVAVAALVIAGAFYYAQRTIRSIEADHAAMQDLSLVSVADGSYTGRCGWIPVFVDLTVRVGGNVIEDVTINKQRSGPGYDARETVRRIVEAQSPRVDAVTGATLSSKCIMVAAYRALKSGETALAMLLGREE